MRRRSPLVVTLVVFMALAPPIGAARWGDAVRSLAESARQILRELKLPDVDDVTTKRGSRGIDALEQVNACRIDICATLTDVVEGRHGPSVELLVRLRRQVCCLHMLGVDVGLFPSVGPADSQCSAALATVQGYIECALVVARRGRDERGAAGTSKGSVHLGENGSRSRRATMVR